MKNKIYFYNNNNIIHVTINYNKLYKIFNYFFSSRKKFLLNKVFLYIPNIKYTNSKILITLYIHNREKYIVLKNILNQIKRIKKYISYIILYKNYIAMNYIYNKYKTYLLKLYYVNYKFHKNWLNILSFLLTNIFKKKVEFNIIKQKYYQFNVNMITEIITLKSKKFKANYRKTIKHIFNTLPNKRKIITNMHDKLLLYYIFSKINNKNVNGLYIEMNGILANNFRSTRTSKLFFFKGQFKGTTKKITYSINNSKKGLGTFAVKGWLTTK